MLCFIGTGVKIKIFQRKKRLYLAVSLVDTAEKFRPISNQHIWNTLMMCLFIPDLWWWRKGQKCVFSGTFKSINNQYFYFYLTCFEWSVVRLWLYDDDTNKKYKHFSPVPGYHHGTLLWLPLLPALWREIQSIICLHLAAAERHSSNGLLYSV